MHKNSKVMPIFRRSSGILKTVMSLFITSAPGLISCVPFHPQTPVWERSGVAWPCRSAKQPRKTLARVSLLRWARFHFVSLGLLARRNQIRAAALGLDLVHYRLGKMMRLDYQSLGHIAHAQDKYATRRS